MFKKENHLFILLFMYLLYFYYVIANRYNSIIITIV